MFSANFGNCEELSMDECESVDYCMLDETGECVRVWDDEDGDWDDAFDFIDRFYVNFYHAEHTKNNEMYLHYGKINKQINVFEEFERSQHEILSEIISIIKPLLTFSGWP